MGMTWAPGSAGWVYHTITAGELLAYILTTLCE